jgi:Ubiquitin family
VHVQTGDGQEILDSDIIGQGLLSQDAPVIGTLPADEVTISTEGSHAVVDAAREALRQARPGQGVHPLKQDHVVCDGVPESKSEDGFVLRYRNGDGSVRVVPHISLSSTWWDVCTEILAQELRLRGIDASSDAGKLSVMLFAWCGQPLLPNPSLYLQTLSDFGVTSGECVHALLVPSADDALVASCTTGLDPEVGAVPVWIHSSSGAKYVVKIHPATDSVLSLKRKLFSKENIPVPAQKLVFNGKILDNANVGCRNFIRVCACFHLSPFCLPVRPLRHGSGKPASAMTQ